MKRFFLIPLLALAFATVGCTCSVRGSASIPTKSPTASPTMRPSPTATVMPVTPEPSMAAESVAPVEPTPGASVTAGTTAGN